MTDDYRLILHPDLARQYQELEKAAEAAGGLLARRFAIVQDGDAALCDGREAEYNGERLGYSEKHADLHDCAEIKLAVVREFNRKGQPMGPSHRIVYREFDSPDDDPRPVRQLLAYEPRRGGRPFSVTAQRLGRSAGRSIDALNQLPTVEPAMGPAKGPRPTGPLRRPMPSELAAAFKAASNPAPAHLASSPPRDHPQASVPERPSTVGSERTM